MSNLSVTGATIGNAGLSASAAIARSKLAQDALALYTIPLTSLRVWDSHALLPSAGAADDLGLVSGTFGTEPPHLSANDLGAAAATTRYARGEYQLPAEYDDGQSVSFRVSAATQTAIADVSCTVDFEVYESDEDLTLSADLVTTAATSMNSVTFANYDFVVTPTGLIAGSVLDFRIAIACNDAATAIVEPTIASLKLMCDIRG
jgi:hypothetical protein